MKKVRPKYVKQIILEPTAWYNRKWNLDPSSHLLRLNLSYESRLLFCPVMLWGQVREPEHVREGGTESELDFHTLIPGDGFLELDLGSRGPGETVTPNSSWATYFLRVLSTEVVPSPLSGFWTHLSGEPIGRGSSHGSKISSDVSQLEKNAIDNPLSFPLLVLCHPEWHAQLPGSRVSKSCSMQHLTLWVSASHQAT